jgi:3-oxoacyl-[acyl-carrier-protein] synthase-1
LNDISEATHPGRAARLAAPRQSPVVTAYSVANALGVRAADVAEALAAGRSGLAPCRLDVPFETAAGHFPDVLEPLPPSLAPFDTRLVRMAVAALDGVAGAVERASRRFGADRVAIVLGTSTGGILETEDALRAHAGTGALPAGFSLERQHAFDGLLAAVRRRTGVGGPGWVVSTACSSSGKVLGSARRLLASGRADAVLTGGVDTLCQTTLRGFRTLEALSSRPCRPFSAERDGISLGEGGAFLLVERDGDGPARLLGVGETSDAHHMSHPHPEGLGARLAMEEALRQGGVAGQAVDHVNAHGTGTPANDVVEARAIAAAVGPGALVASTKGYTGHLLGAAGATEAVLSILAMERGLVPASLGAAPLDAGVNVAVSLAPLRRACRIVLSNSFAFGGSNVAVLLGSAA